MYPGRRHRRGCWIQEEATEEGVEVKETRKVRWDWEERGLD